MLGEPACHGFQTILLQAVEQKPPSHLRLMNHIHIETLLYPGGQVKTNVCNRNLNLGNKRLIQLVVSGTQQTFCDHEGYDTSLPSKTEALGTLKGHLPNFSPVSVMSAPGISVFPLATFSHHSLDREGTGGTADWLPTAALRESNQSLLQEQRNDFQQIHGGSSLS